MIIWEDRDVGMCWLAPVPSVVTSMYLGVQNDAATRRLRPDVTVHAANAWQWTKGFSGLPPWMTRATPTDTTSTDRDINPRRFFYCKNFLALRVVARGGSYLGTRIIGQRISRWVPTPVRQPPPTPCSLREPRVGTASRSCKSNLRAPCRGIDRPCGRSACCRAPSQNPSRARCAAP